MKNFLIIFFSLILIPSLSCAERPKPVVTSLTYYYNTGPIPPPYFYESLTKIDIDHANKTFTADYELTPIAVKDAQHKKEKFNGSFGGVDYDELMKLISDIKICKVKEPKEILVGGHESSVTITGPQTEQKFWRRDTCQEGWWNSFEPFAASLVNSMKNKDKSR